MSLAIPKQDIKTFVSDLAKQHNLSDIEARTCGNEWSAKLAELFGDQVKPDETECRLLALKRAKIINRRDWVVLYCKYFDEKYSRRNEV